MFVLSLRRSWCLHIIYCSDQCWDTLSEYMNEYIPLWCKRKQKKGKKQTHLRFLRMDRAQESQSTGELILSVPNCIYWLCLAPPNPGLWWCINSCDWLFTRHLLAGVNITRQIPPITLITPLPGLCHCQVPSRMTHGLRLHWGCFLFSCISHCYMAIRLPPQKLSAQQCGADVKFGVNKERELLGGRLKITGEELWDQMHAWVHQSTKTIFPT